MVCPPPQPHAASARGGPGAGLPCRGLCERGRTQFHAIPLISKEIADTAAGAAHALTSDDMQSIDRSLRAAIRVGGPSPQGTFTMDVEPLVPPDRTGSA